jgi:hypothetical protein
MQRAVVATAVALALIRGDAPAQTPDAFTSLFDGRTLGGWIVEGSDGANFSVQDGVLRVGEPQGWLRSEREFGDYELRLEFRLVSDGADSGVFNRAAGTDAFARGWPNRSYQVQLRDMDRPSRFLPLGQIYRHGMPAGDTELDEALLSTLYGSVGEWHELVIQVSGSVLTVALEGRVITRAENIASPSGFIGFQGEAGVVEYRNIRVRELD